MLLRVPPATARDVPAVPLPPVVTPLPVPPVEEFYPAAPPLTPGSLPGPVLTAPSSGVTPMLKPYDSTLYGGHLAYEPVSDWQARGLLNPMDYGTYDAGRQMFGTSFSGVQTQIDVLVQALHPSNPLAALLPAGASSNPMVWVLIIGALVGLWFVIRKHS